MSDHELGRRTLLRASSLAAAVAAAGCTVEIGGFEVGVGGDGTQTPTYGYGGTTAGTDTHSPADGTDAATATATSSEPPARTATPADDYGQQGYGQYEYGG